MWILFNGIILRKHMVNEQEHKFNK